MFVEVLLIFTLLVVTTIAQYIAFDQTSPFFQAFDWKMKNDWVGRIMATLCHIAMFLFAGFGTPTSPWSNSIMIAYFLHDAAHCMLYTTNLTNYIHHVVGIAVSVLRQTVMTPEQAHSAYLATLNLESTSPFLNATWLMRAAGYKDHPAFKYLAGFALIFFGLMRVLVFPWLMYARMDRVSAAVFSPFLALNVYWFYKLIRMAQRAIATKDGDDRLE